MDWNAVGATAEAVAAIGVIATLLYVAVQIRQNTRALRAATFQHIIGLATGFSEGVARDSNLAALFQAGMADLESLPDPDRFRFHWQMVAFLRRYENMHYHSMLGFLDDAQWEGLRASLNYTMRRPGSQAWWNANSFLFNSGFRSFMDERLRIDREESPANNLEP